jgi:hypothetical protein
MPNRKFLQFMLLFPAPILFLGTGGLLYLWLDGNSSPRTDALGMFCGSLAIFSGYILFLAWSWRKLSQVTSYMQTWMLLAVSPPACVLLMFVTQLVSGVAASRIVLSLDTVLDFGLVYGYLVAIGYSYALLAAIGIWVEYVFRRGLRAVRDGWSKPKPVRDSI